MRQTLEWSHFEFGKDAASRYRDLIVQALRDWKRIRCGMGRGREKNSAQASEPIICVRAATAFLKLRTLFAIRGISFFIGFANALSMSFGYCTTAAIFSATFLVARAARRKSRCSSLLRFVVAKAIAVLLMKSLTLGA
jgi:hypothetical protein